MTIYRIGPFQLVAERLTLTAGGKPVCLGPRVVETLLALVERAGETVGKDELLDRVWPAGFVEESNLTQNVYVLRKAFRESGVADAIQTVPRAGYRLTLPAQRISERPPEARRRRSFGAAAVAATACGLLAALLAFVQGDTRGPHGSGSSLSPDAQRLYVIGRYYWNLRTSDGVRKSFGYFARVIDADPQSPLGYAAMADANVTMGDYCFGTHRPAVYFARARSYAQKALALDPDSAQAHAALGFAQLHGSNTALGLFELNRAIALDPGYAPAHEWLGVWLVRHGEAARALGELRIAANLEPLSVSTTEWLGFAALRLQRRSEASAYAREALELSPQYRIAPPPPGHPTWAQLENASRLVADHG